LIRIRILKSEIRNVLCLTRIPTSPTAFFRFKTSQFEIRNPQLSA
jgi:hypothetical protein